MVHMGDGNEQQTCRTLLKLQTAVVGMTLTGGFFVGWRSKSCLLHLIDAGEHT